MIISKLRYIRFKNSKENYVTGANIFSLKKRKNLLPEQKICNWGHTYFYQESGSANTITTKPILLGTSE